MPARTRVILRRVNSVRSTRKITRAMEMVASAKLKGAQRRVLELGHYSSRLHHIMQTALSFCGLTKHPLLQERPQEKTALVLVTSDKGLCGAYNSNVIRRAIRLWEEEAEQRGGVICVGLKGQRYLRRRGIPILHAVRLDGTTPSFKDAQRVVDLVVKVFLDRSVDRVRLVYTEFDNAAVQYPEVQDLLPFSYVTPGPDYSRHMFWQPDSQTVLDRLIPEYLGTMVYRALLESNASEFAARRVAMKSATDNATEMIAKLTLEFNRARQAAITQEIAEIVGGAEALE